MVQSSYSPEIDRSIHTLKQFLTAVLIATVLLVKGSSALSYPSNSHDEVIIPNALSVKVYDRKIPDAKDADAWIFVTDGLKSVVKDEIILTVLNTKKTSYKDVAQAKVERVEHANPTNTLDFELVMTVWR